MPDLWSDLLACLELKDAGDGAFEGRNQQLGYHRLFGGQLLAQFVRAAGLACPGKAVKSVHALFPSAGRTDEPVHYEVETHREGTSFATLSIVARQSPGVTATALASLHAAEDGPTHQRVPGVPPVPGHEHRRAVDLLPWEVRSAVDLDSPAVGPPELELWMRTPPVDGEHGSALLAYATDLTLIGTALRPFDGISQRDAGTAFVSAVTSHTVWFHRAVRTDEWLLLRQAAPVVAHGRCHGRGDVLTADGTPVASYAQEALLRFPQSGS